MTEAETKLREDIVTHLRAAVATCEPGAPGDAYRELARRAMESAVPITGRRDDSNVYEELIIALFPIMRVAGAPEDVLVAFVLQTVLAPPDFIRDFWKRLTPAPSAESAVVRR